MNFGRDQTKFPLKSVQALREVRDPVWTVASSSHSWLVKKGRLYPMQGNMFPCLRREIRIIKKKSFTYLSALKLSSLLDPGGNLRLELRVQMSGCPAHYTYDPLLATGGHLQQEQATVHTPLSPLIAHCPLPAFLKKKNHKTLLFFGALCFSSKSKKKK